MADFQEIQERAQELKSSLSERDALFKSMEAMFFLEPEDQGQIMRKEESVKLTLSPDPRNKVLGASRMLATTDPVWEVTQQGQKDDELCNAVEQWAAHTWNTACQIANTSWHYEGALSTFIYGEAHIAVLSTRELEKYNNGKGKAYKARAERAARRTPYLYDVYSPNVCFHRSDRLGLVEHYREVDTQAKNVIADWGNKGAKALGTEDSNDNVTLCEWWDLENQAVWIKANNDQSIENRRHNLPFIPIASGITSDGSERLFDDAAKQRQPLLFTVDQSQLWKRQNLVLTALNTILFAIITNPTIIYAGEGEIDASFENAGGVWQIRPGESVSQLKLGLSPELLQSLEIANQKIEESTIYSQSLGASLGKNAAYSMVALLSQIGRQPVINPQRKLSGLVGTAMDISLTWLKIENGILNPYAEPGKQRMAADIPEDLEITAKLEVDLPQDKLQAGNIATMLTEKGLVSKEWARNETLNIGQSKDMDKQIMVEKFSEMLAQFFSQQELTQLMQAAMSQDMPPEVGGAPQGAPPMQGGLPPEMAMAGGQPPMELPGQEVNPNVEPV